MAKPNQTLLTELDTNKVYAVSHNTRNIFTTKVPIVITKPLDNKTGLLTGYALTDNLIKQLMAGITIAPLSFRPDEFNGIAYPCKPLPINSETQLKPFDVIQHVKSGGIYVMLCIAYNESSLASKCVYVSLSTSQIWERPLVEIFEEVLVDDVPTTRFKLYGNLKTNFDIDYSGE